MIFRPRVWGSSRTELKHCPHPLGSGQKSERPADLRQMLWLQHGWLYATLLRRQGKPGLTVPHNKEHLCLPETPYLKGHRMPEARTVEPTGKICFYLATQPDRRPKSVALKPQRQTDDRLLLLKTQHMMIFCESLESVAVVILILLEVIISVSKNKTVQDVMS